MPEKALSPLLSTEQAAKLLRQNPSTLRAWRSERRGPPYVDLGPRNKKYRLSDLERYIAERVRTPRQS